MPTPLFIATEPFKESDGERWKDYFEWAKIPAITEIAGLDSLLCPPLVTTIEDEDWNYIVQENFRLEYFYDLNYLMQRTRDISPRNILGVYRNPETHIATPPAENFDFMGYDLVEDQTQISALVNCGGFPDVFRNEELNRFGLIDAFERAREVRRLLAERHPEEPHAQCEMYAVWRLNEDKQAGGNA